MASINILLLLGLLGALLVAVLGAAAYLFFVVFKKGLNLPITTKEQSDSQTPS